MEDAWSSQENCWGQSHILNFAALQGVRYRNVPSLILVYAFLEAGAEDLILQQTDGKIGTISFAVPLYPVSEHSPKTWIQVPTTPWWNESHIHYLTEAWPNYSGTGYPRLLLGKVIHLPLPN